MKIPLMAALLCLLPLGSGWSQDDLSPAMKLNKHLYPIVRVMKGWSSIGVGSCDKEGRIMDVPVGNKPRFQCVIVGFRENQERSFKAFNFLYPVGTQIGGVFVASEKKSSDPQPRMGGGN